ncbi:hypothetical protein AVEN_172487-1 [Araneus ventricosus]|uniref:Uncharacterized protein n=1 Tax=Araneus ventricosus TaxID=182803 RepID=A0A4Y2DTU3_ARAVE|nr:hypothetical protein AVEN_172487-1 [Araneus ventricosus]
MAGVTLEKRDTKAPIGKGSYNTRSIEVVARKLEEWVARTGTLICPLLNSTRAETKYPAVAQFSDSILLKPVEIRGSSSGIFRSPRVTPGRDPNAPRALLRRLPIGS